jgi:formylglycine-generating enzyme required for sulfatase activity
LASASEDGTARVWETSSGDERSSFVHAGPVFDVAFAADDAALLTASGELVARVWALAPGPWLAWGCAMLDARASHDDATRRACVSASTNDVAIAGVLAEPIVIEGDGPRHEVIVVHGVEYVFVPGGTFLMGSPPGVGHNDEQPQHEVTLDGFYMARTELTNAQYAEFLDANPNVEKPPGWGELRWNQPNHPVVGVFWSEAKAYCEWAGCRLPTEAQWEYAARAGTTTVYWHGDTADELNRFAWTARNSGARLHSVAKKGANAFGLHDMIGNLFEWTLDSYSDDYTAEGLRDGPSRYVDRVVRGGCWSREPNIARPGDRVGSEPEYRDSCIGFRPLVTIP